MAQESLLCWGFIIAIIQIVVDSRLFANKIMANVKPPPTNFYGEVDSGRGSPLDKNSIFLDPTENFSTLNFLDLITFNYT